MLANFILGAFGLHAWFAKVCEIFPKLRFRPGSLKTYGSSGFAFEESQVTVLGYKTVFQKPPGIVQA